jgi:hypothetical protein
MGSHRSTNLRIGITGASSRHSLGLCHLLDQLHLGTFGVFDESDVATVADLLQHDVSAVAAQPGNIAGVIVGLQCDVLDAHHLLAVLGGADGGDVELQPVQVELDIAVGGLVFIVAPKLSM